MKVHIALPDVVHLLPYLTWEKKLQGQQQTKKVKMRTDKVCIALRNICFGAVANRMHQGRNNDQQTFPVLDELAENLHQQLLDAGCQANSKNLMQVAHEYLFAKYNIERPADIEVEQLLAMVDAKLFGSDA